ncbi:hypothetical protein GCM10020001_021020 [Nonomuraea salmonea]
MPPVIEVRDLHKRYDDKIAVDDVSLTVQEGEIFGILGPNGAGKTTTVELTRLGVTARVLVLTTPTPASFPRSRRVRPGTCSRTLPGGPAAGCAGRRQGRERAVPFGGGTADEPGQAARAATAQPA